jgi:hypothetical protein
MDCFVAEFIVGPAETPDPVAPRNDVARAHAASVFSTSLIQYEVPNTIASSLKL